MALTRDSFLQFADEVIYNIKYTTDPHGFIAQRLRDAGVEVPRSEEEKLERIYQEWHDYAGPRFDTFAEWAVARGVTVQEPGE